MKRILRIQITSRLRKKRKMKKKRRMKNLDKLQQRKFSKPNKIRLKWRQKRKEWKQKLKQGLMLCYIGALLSQTRHHLWLVNYQIPLKTSLTCQRG
jgi:hypothetical protein